RACLSLPRRGSARIPSRTRHEDRVVDACRSRSEDPAPRCLARDGSSGSRTAIRRRGCCSYHPALQLLYQRFAAVPSLDLPEEARWKVRPHADSSQPRGFFRGRSRVRTKDLRGFFAALTQRTTARRLLCDFQDRMKLVSIACVLALGVVAASCRKPA